MPFGDTLQVVKSFGQCFPGQAYQVVASYTSSNVWYGGVSSYVTSGAPKAIC
jgi:hypothetical protein